MAWTRQGAAVTDPASFIAPLPVFFSEETANDSDKSFTIATDAGDGTLKVVRIRLEYTATATVGNRTLALELQDSGADVIYQMHADDTSGEGLVVGSASVALEFGAGMARVAPQNSGASVQYLPWDFYLYPGFVFRIYDTAAIDAAADDMTVHLSCLKVA